MHRLTAKPSLVAVIRRFSATLAVAVLGLAAAAPSYANLVVDGNFANPNVGTGWNAYSNGAVPGWTNTSNRDGIEIDYSAILGGSAYQGTTQSAELNGTTWDTISQTITGLVVGADYILSWAYGERPGSGQQETIVSFGGNPVTTDTSSGNATNLTWTLNTFDVTATSTTETLNFAAVAGLGSPSVGNEITAVSLTKYVPEPATLLLMAAGALGFLIRRRNTL